MWVCSNCEETLPDQFDTCCKCGTNNAHIRQSGLQNADEHVPNAEAETRQFALIDLFLFVNGIGIALGGCANDNSFLFITGMGILVLMVACWIAEDNFHLTKRPPKDV